LAVVIAEAPSLTSPPPRLEAPSSESTRPRARAIRKSMSATRTADSGAQLVLSVVSAINADDALVSCLSSQPPQHLAAAAAASNSSSTSSRRLRAETDEGSSSCAAPDATADAS